MRTIMPIRINLAFRPPALWVACRTTVPISFQGRFTSAELAEVKIGSLPATDDRQWFETFDSTGWHWSYSFTVAEDLYQFITGTGRGYYVGTENGDSLSQTLPAAMSYGDPLFYRWQFSHTAEDHVGVLAAYGYDPQSGWYGWLQDQHTTNRRHAFWSLAPYNQLYASTEVDLVHVNASAA